MAEAGSASRQDPGAPETPANAEDDERPTAARAEATKTARARAPAAETRGLRSPRRAGSRPSGARRATMNTVPLMRKGERESVETFMWDKERGQRALQKRRQVREDVHVCGTEAALVSSLERQGVLLAESNVVLDDSQAFLDKTFAAALPFETHAESHVRRGSELTRRSTGISSTHLGVLDSPHGQRMSGRPDGKSFGVDGLDILDEDEGDLDGGVSDDEPCADSRSRDCEESAEERAKMEQAEEELRRVQRERAEKIFFFYEQVDQVVARIANTLARVNKSELQFAMQLGDKFVNDPAIEASKDISASRASLVQLLGPAANDLASEKVLEISFWTEEEAEEFRTTHESLEKLTAAINVAAFSENLYEVGEWVHGRRKQSMAEEKEFYTLMQEVEEQEAEAEGSSRSVRLMLREKGQLAETKLQRFGETLSKVKTKGKQLNALLAQFDADTAARQSKQTHESISMLESQIAILRARILDADSKIKHEATTEDDAEADRALKAEQARLDLASEGILSELERVQAKNALLAKQVAVSNDVLHILDNLAQQVELKVAFRLPAGANEAQETSKLEEENGDNTKYETKSGATDDSEADNKVCTDTESIATEASSDTESVGSDEEEFAAEIAELEASIENAKADQTAALEEQAELEDRLKKRKSEVEAMPTAMEREARLVDKINEVKKVRDAEKTILTDKAALEHQAGEIKKLEKEKFDLEVELGRLDARFAKSKGELAATVANLEKVSEQLALYAHPSVTTGILKQGRKHKVSAASAAGASLRGPRGDIGPDGDEAPEMMAEPPMRSLEELRAELADLFQQAYAPFFVDPETGNRMARTRTNAVVVRSERVGEVLLREEAPNMARELECLRNDRARLELVGKELQVDLDAAAADLSGICARAKDKSSQGVEIQRRLAAATKHVATLRNQLARDRATMNTQRRSMQTSYEEELRTALEDMENMGEEVLQLKERMADVAHEAAQRASHSERAQDLLQRQQGIHRKLFRQVARLREEARLDAAENPGQRATRVRRQIKALELGNVKLHRKLRELQSQLQRKQAQARRRAEARQAAIRAGREPEPLNEVDNLFRDDDDTRARKAALRKQITKSMRQLSRWRQRWQAAKRAAALAAGPRSQQSPNSRNQAHLRHRPQRTAGHGRQEILTMQQQGGFVAMYGQTQMYPGVMNPYALAGTINGDGAGGFWGQGPRRPSLTNSTPGPASGPETHRAMAAIAAKLDVQRRASMQSPQQKTSAGAEIGFLTLSTRPFGSPTAKSQSSPRRGRRLKREGGNQTVATSPFGESGPRRDVGPAKLDSEPVEQRAENSTRSPKRSLLQTLPKSLFSDMRTIRASGVRARRPTAGASSPTHARSVASRSRITNQNPRQGDRASRAGRRSHDQQSILRSPQNSRSYPEPAQQAIQSPQQALSQASAAKTPPPLSPRAGGEASANDKVAGEALFAAAGSDGDELFGWMEPVHVDLSSHLGLS